MKYFQELTRDEICELKQRYLDDIQGSLSYEEMVRADQLVSDDELECAYGACVFSDDDFLCGKEASYA